MEQVYINIKKRREELGLAQRDLAKLCGYKDHTTIAKIETGHVDANGQRELERKILQIRTEYTQVRHTYATTVLYYKGVKKGLITAKKAAQIMGHSEKMFIERYTHIDESKEALDELRSLVV